VDAAASARSAAQADLDTMAGRERCGVIMRERLGLKLGTFSEHVRGMGVFQEKFFLSPKIDADFF
jgi:hypothetical protein